MLLPEGVTSKTNALCLRSHPYPFEFVEKSLDIAVSVESEADLPNAASRFAREVFTALGRPGVTAHPRVLLRSVVNGKRRPICPSSWPTPSWASLMVEQITFDTAGMSPRLLYNDRPWIGQPALYTQVFGVVSGAKQAVKDWAEDSKKEPK